MRAVELAKVAAAAEALRLRRIARRQGWRAAFGAVAAVFAIAVLIVIHVLIWNILASYITPTQASLVLLVLDAVLMAAFGFLALRSTPDPIEEEARGIRAQALFEMRQSLTVMSMVGSVTGLALRTTARQGVRRGATNALANLATRLVRR